MDDMMRTLIEHHRAAPHGEVTQEPRVEIQEDRSFMPRGVCLDFPISMGLLQ